MEPSLLLQRIRRDRRKLLEFVLSSGPVHPLSGAAVDLSDADLDTVSVDHVLDCVQSGGVLDISEANKKFFQELDFPITINSSSGNLYFLLSKPESSGSPPQRAVPPIGLPSNHSPCSKERQDHLFCREMETEIGSGNPAASLISNKPVEDANTLSLGLPALSTGLSDDDMRETAYEVLLSSVVVSGGQILLFQETKHEKKPRFLMGLKSKRDGLRSRQPEDCHSDLLDIIRIQMEISEVLDVCIKQGLRHSYSGMTHEQTDVPQISLVLLSAICKSDFSSERLYTKWQKRQANVLEELLHSSANLVADGHTALSFLLTKLRNTEEWALNIGPKGCSEMLRDIKRFASRLSSMSGKFGIPGETYYWTSSYHFNIRLYEKLLSSVFDVLEDDQVIEEADEILAVFKLTWHILGISQRMHDALYGWVLFQKFVQTGELLLVKHTVHEIRKILSYNDEGGSEEAYMNSLTCSIGTGGCKRDLNLVDSILFNIYVWCSSQLEDYHQHFREEKSVTFESVLTLAILSGTFFADECGEIKCMESMAGIDAASKLVHAFIERSIHAVYKRVLDILHAKSKKEAKHPLAVLANDLKLIAEDESLAFIPVLRQQYPEAGMLSSLLLHQLYGEQLEPFLEGVEKSVLSDTVRSVLSDSVRSVLAASDSLERSLAGNFNSLMEESEKSLLVSLHPYRISHICAPLILHWVNSQHDNILEWTKRAILIEDWEPLSSQQRYAASIIEIFRIIEETIDLFFSLNLPMGIIHLRSLLITIVRSLEAYLQHMVNQQANRNILYPNPPALTRYKELTNPFFKKKPVERIVMEEKVINQLNDLTASKLCVKLNTLHYIRYQLDMVEDSIKQFWMLAQPVNCQILGALMGESLSCESVDELFTIFDDIKRSTFDVSDIIFDFIGTRVIFWDMRDPFLSALYRGSVESARLETFVPELDAVLNHMCDLIIDTLRDQIVLSICQASMDGYVWVMLDGGPSRMFSETDVIMMQEDLNILKDLFIANGQGLPSVVVEKEARLAQQIIDLYALKADSIIEMLMSASEQIVHQPDNKKPGSRCAKAADTLLRVLCHKMDGDASKFLKIQYQLPKSSEYEDVPAKEYTSESPSLPDILKKGASFNWSEKGQRSFRVMMKKFQEATSEIRQAPR